ncbi:hypothetical protein [Macrococcus carouselicus]|uniref:Uncharacterized protein n=1 Tax=Macrococcus carouselicus TaxID=69969 RepID=A0A9Q8FK89_9STAP|nr:hypothetical protein [Macrococcus carouselicus]TDL96623.1 hypothetical protein ERX40_09725 [Macrococcus carouselicus]
MLKEKKRTLIVLAVFLVLIIMLNVWSYIRTRNLEDFLTGIPVLLSLLTVLIGYPIEEYTRKKSSGNMQTKPLSTRKKWSLIGGLAYGVIALLLLAYALIFKMLGFSTSFWNYFYLAFAFFIAIIAGLYFRDYFRMKRED